MMPTYRNGELLDGPHNHRSFALLLPHLASNWRLLWIVDERETFRRVSWHCETATCRSKETAPTKNRTSWLLYIWCGLVNRRREESRGWDVLVSSTTNI